jgi:hypothetical protein
MTDTPKHIEDLQWKIWLSKSPEERLLQFLINNDAMWNALKKAKQKLNLPDTVSNFPKQKKEYSD